MLSQFLVSELFAFLLIFCRLGTAFMFLPGFGESYVAPRIRLFLALMFSVVLVPVVKLPPVPVTAFGLTTLIIAESLIGLFIGVLTRLMIAAMHMGAAVIAYESSMLSAITPSLSQTQAQDTSLGNFLSVSAVVLLFATDMHHIMIRALADSYTLFLPGQFPVMDDFAKHVTTTMSGAFRTAMQLAGPHIVIGILFYLAAGIIARLMPNIQIFFIMVPPQLLFSFFVLMIVTSAILMWYLEYFKDTLSVFMYPG